MGRYQSNPARANMAGFIIFDKNVYNFTIVSHKPFESKDNVTNQVKNYGVRTTLICKDAGPFEGKKLTFAHYLHTEGGEGLSKNFRMAAYGFDVKPENEEAFNLQADGLDWGFDTETGEVGEGWKKMEGIDITLSLDVVLNKNPNDPNAEPKPQQKFVAFIPAGRIG